MRVNRNYIALGFFALLSILFYGNTLLNGFVQDDVGQIKENVYLRSLSNIQKVITGCPWEYTNKGCMGRTFYYRPIHYLAYFLTYQISPSPLVFHLANLVCFWIAAFLVFVLAKKISGNFVFAIFSSLFFLIHPINSEVANWISAASDLLVVIFILLTVIFYFEYREKNSQKNLFLTYLFYFFALLSKENAALLPLALLALDIFFFGKRIREILTWKEIKKYLFFGVPFFIYFLMRKSVIGSYNYLGNFTFSERIYAFFALFAKYLEKVFWPYPQQAFYDFQILPNLSNPGFIISLFTDLTMVILFIFLIKKQKNILALSFVWFVVFLTPALIFLSAAGAGVSVFFERYMFVSMVGPSLAFGYVILAISKSPIFLKAKTLKYLFLVFAVALIAIMASVSWKRNTDWKSNETLYVKTLSQVPSASHIRYQLGFIYLQTGRFEEAKFEFEESLKNPLWKDKTMAYKGLGDYYKARNDLDNALISYQKAVQSAAPSPRDFITFNDLGTAYMSKGDYLKGLIYFCQSLILLPGTETVMNNFNAAASLVDSNYVQKNILYDKILEEFKLSPEQKIQYIGKNCTAETCQYAFSVDVAKIDVMLPFLLAAVSGKEEVKIKNPTFDQQQGIIGLEIDKNFSSKDLIFVFPGCSGYYDKVEVKLSKQ